VGENPDQIRSDIAQTRGDLSYTLDEIGNRVSPGRMVERRRARMRDRWDSVTRRVMGSDAGGSAQRGDYSTLEKGSNVGTTARNAPAALGSAAGSAASSVSSGASSVRDTVSNAPSQMRDQAEGNPLAAGIIAFGAGLLAATLIPPSRAEQQAASTLQEKAQPLKEEAKQVGSEVGSNLSDAAKQAAQEVKTEAQSAADTVKQEAQSSASQVSDHAKSGAQDVKEDAKTSAQDVKEGGEKGQSPSY
jgi:gas vesicle protein